MRTAGDPMQDKRACPMCQGIQCPCPSASALLPSLPTVPPPRVIVAPEKLPARGEMLLELPSAPEEMPAAPASGDEAETFYESPSVPQPAEG